MSDLVPMKFSAVSAGIGDQNRKIKRVKKFMRNNGFSFKITNAGFEIQGAGFDNILASIEEVEGWCIGYVAAFAEQGKYFKEEPSC
jgi:hypothetical protein